METADATAPIFPEDDPPTAFKKGHYTAGGGQLFGSITLNNFRPRERIEFPDSIDLEAAVVPEPSTVELLAAGLVLLSIMRRKGGDLRTPNATWAQDFGGPARAGEV